MKSSYYLIKMFMTRYEYIFSEIPIRQLKEQLVHFDAKKWK